MDQSASNDDREIRAARNQALFRAVNEKMYELNQAFGEVVGTFSVACECADVRCIQLLEVPAETYSRVRDQPRMFVVHADHVFPEMERVVSSHGEYAIVEAIGSGVEHEDAAGPGPRGASSSSAS